MLGERVEVLGVIDLPLDPLASFRGAGASSSLIFRCFEGDLPPALLALPVFVGLLGPDLAAGCGIDLSPVLTEFSSF